jgi:hypothetical protein
MRALYPPPNDERLSPEQIPHDASAFERWSNFACVEWPVDLIIKGASALYTLRGERGSDRSAIDRFHHEYFKWWLLSESDKEAAMLDCQRWSRRRSDYRRLARTARR